MAFSYMIRGVRMATSSIFADVVINCEESAKAIVKVFEEFETKGFPRETVKDSPVLDAKDIKDFFSKEVGEMCNFSEGIFDAGKIEGAVESVRSFVNNGCGSIQDAIRILVIDADIRKEVMRRLSESDEATKTTNQ